MSAVGQVTESSGDSYILEESAGQYIMLEVDDIGFEKIEAEMGKAIIFVSRDRRNHYYEQNGIVDKQYKEKVALNVSTYRGFGPIAITAAKIAFQGGTVLMAVAPTLTTVFPTIEDSVNSLTHWNVRFLSGHFFKNDKTFDFSAMAGAIGKVTDYGEKIMDSVNFLYGNSQQAKRIEFGSESDRLKSLAQEKQQEQLRSLSDEQEAIRNYENRRNKRDDFMMGLARG